MKLQIYDLNGLLEKQCQLSGYFAELGNKSINSLPQTIHKCCLVHDIFHACNSTKSELDLLRPTCRNWLNSFAFQAPLWPRNKVNDTKLGRHSFKELTYVFSEKKPASKLLPWLHSLTNNDQFRVTWFFMQVKKWSLVSHLSLYST